MCVPPGGCNAASRGCTNPQTLEKLTQFAKRTEFNLRSTQTHAAACDRIEHPRGNRNDIPGIYLDVNDLARSMFLTI